MEGRADNERKEWEVVFLRAASLSVVVFLLL